MWYNKLDFWKGISLVAAGVLTVLFTFGVITQDQVIGADAILVVILGFLHWININPTVKSFLKLE